MFKRILLGTVLLTLFIGCYNRPSDKSDSQMHSKTADSIWGNKRKKQLVKIVSYTDNIITKKVNEKNLNKAYHLYLDSIYEEVLKGNRRAIGLGIKEEKKVGFLGKLDKNTYQEIWSTEKKLNRSYEDKFYNRTINNQGLIVDYIKVLSIKNKNYIGLYEGILYTGGVSPTFLAGFISNHTKFDFSKFDNRLILAIIFLNIYESGHPAYPPANADS